MSVIDAPASATSFEGTGGTEAPGSGRRRPLGKIVVGLLGLVAALVLSACNYMGSGTITSATGRGNATFSFNLKCPSGRLASGYLIYTDSAARVSIRATAAPGQPCSGLAPSGTEFTGTYVPLNGGTGGTFDLEVYPGGSSQSDVGYFGLELSGGAYDGYSNEGTVYKGNVVLTSY